MTEVYNHGAINWTWYIELERVNKRQCKIVKHWRVHNSDVLPKSIGRFHIKEDEEPRVDDWPSRNAIGVRVWNNEKVMKLKRGESDDGLLLKVLNPGYVFGYDGKTEQPAMHNR